jgi:hypothetical protein
MERLAMYTKSSWLFGVLFVAVQASENTFMFNPLQFVAYRHNACHRWLRCLYLLEYGRRHTPHDNAITCEVNAFPNGRFTASLVPGLSVQIQCWNEARKGTKTLGIKSAQSAQSGVRAWEVEIDRFDKRRVGLSGLAGTVQDPCGSS